MWTITLMFTRTMNHHTRPDFQKISSHPAGIGAVMRDRPDKYMMLMAHAQEILREPSHLSPTDREVIAAFTSRLNGCEYCCGSHTAFAESLGATPDDTRVIETLDTTGHRLSALLEYARVLTLSPSSISAAHKAAVHDAGFNEDELKDAIAVCAAFNLFNRIVEGHGIAPRDDYSSDAQQINTHGYDRRR